MTACHAFCVLQCQRLLQTGTAGDSNRNRRDEITGSARIGQTIERVRLTVVLTAETPCARSTPSGVCAYDDAGNGTVKWERC